uniref:Uncharacterized protein n=1 Tax=Heterorhabditis bacteriophora TaxID=37862 RepID=A0A1I7WKF7_HETBA
MIGVEIGRLLCDIVLIQNVKRMFFNFYLKFNISADLSQTEKTNAVDTKYLIPPRPPSSRASTRYLRSSRERSSSMKKKSETQQVNRSPSSIGKKVLLVESKTRI